MLFWHPRLWQCFIRWRILCERPLLVSWCFQGFVDWISYFSQVLCTWSYRERSGHFRPLSWNRWISFRVPCYAFDYCRFEHIAVNVVAKDIFATTETGAPVAVMCNSTTVWSTILCYDQHDNCVCLLCVNRYRQMSGLNAGTDLSLGAKLAYRFNAPSLLSMSTSSTHQSSLRRSLPILYIHCTF